MMPHLLHRTVMSISYHLPLLLCMRVSGKQETGAYEGVSDPPFLAGQSTSYAGGMEMSEWLGGRQLRNLSWGHPWTCLLLSISVFSCKHLLLASVRGNKLNSPLVSPSCEQAIELFSQEHSGKGTLCTGGDLSSWWIPLLLPQWQKGTLKSSSDLLGICTSIFSHKHTGKVSHGWLSLASLFRQERQFCPQRNNREGKKQNE